MKTGILSGIVIAGFGAFLALSAVSINSSVGSAVALEAPTPTAGALPADVPFIDELPTPETFPTVEPLATRPPTVPPPTPDPQEAALAPTVSLDPGFDPAHPFRFCSGAACVDLADPVEMVINMPFARYWTAVTPVLYTPGVEWREVFPPCDTTVLITNAKDGASPSEVWHKTIMYVHSGRCRGAPHPGEGLRIYLEGGYYSPSLAQRERRLSEILGQTLTIDQGDGLVTFVVADAVHLDDERVKAYAEDPGALDRFFPSGVQEGKHEIFLIICGSVGLQPTNPLDFFNNRYILRLQVVGEPGA